MDSTTQSRLTSASRLPSIAAGIVLLDKPTGMTSNAALQKVKRLLKARKAGHTGSLDPLASGLLPICLGEATKLSSYLLTADKRYQLIGQWGAKTNTGDAEGEIIERSDVSLSRNMLSQIIPDFLGNTDQIPPMYSALKHKGQRLYELARQGKVVEREARPITIHELILETVTDNTFEMFVSCSKGTYIRTLVEDLAAAAGGLAHVIQLRRVGVGPFEETAMVTLAELEHIASEDPQGLAQHIIPIDRALADWPAVELTADSAFYLQNGQAVQVPGAPTDGWVRIYQPGDQFLGVGEIASDGRVAPRRLFVK